LYFQFLYTDSVEVSLIDVDSFDLSGKQREKIAILKENDN